MIFCKTKTNIATFTSSYSFISYLTVANMATILIVVFVINLSSCCWSLVPVFAEHDAVAESRTSCPATKADYLDHVELDGQFPKLPFINVTAEAERNGFCRTSFTRETLAQRLKIDPDNKYNAVSTPSSFRKKNNNIGQ